jgi:hypothetical protein
MTERFVLANRVLVYFIVCDKSFKMSLHCILHYCGVARAEAVKSVFQYIILDMEKLSVLRREVSFLNRIWNEFISICKIPDVAISVAPSLDEAVEMVKEGMRIDLEIDHMPLGEIEKNSSDFESARREFGSYPNEEINRFLEEAGLDEDVCLQCSWYLDMVASLDEQILTNRDLDLDAFFADDAIKLYDEYKEKGGTPWDDEEVLGASFRAITQA